MLRSFRARLGVKKTLQRIRGRNQSKHLSLSSPDSGGRWVWGGGRGEEPGTMKALGMTVGALRGTKLEPKEKKGSAGKILHIFNGKDVTLRRK